MSSVRMCDKCHTVFSELMDGWQSYSATTTKRDENGEPKTVQVHMDACPSCALVPTFTDTVSAANDYGFERLALSKENADLTRELADLKAKPVTAVDVDPPAA